MPDYAFPPDLLQQSPEARLGYFKSFHDCTPPPEGGRCGFETSHPGAYRLVTDLRLWPDWGG